jgi:hypothetical protein
MMHRRNTGDRKTQVGGRRAIGKGVFLGALASLTLSTLFVTIELAGFLIGDGSEVSPSVEGVVLVVLLGLGILALTVVPASVGGGVNALVLYELSRRTRATLGIGLIVGAASGVLWWFIVAAIGGWIITLGLRAGDWAIMAPIGMAVGLWHSWRMLRYLQREAREAEMQETVP